MLIFQFSNYPDTKDDETESSVILCQVVGFQLGSRRLNWVILKVHCSLERLWTSDEHLCYLSEVHLHINPPAPLIYLSTHYPSANPSVLF